VALVFSLLKRRGLLGGRSLLGTEGNEGKEDVAMPAAAAEELSSRNVAILAER